MLNALSDSKVKFNITNTFHMKNGKPVKNILSYGGIDSKGRAKINAAPLMLGTMNRGQEVETLAHELFHGYQDMKGEKGATVNREVGAYLFGRSVAMLAGYGMNGFGGKDYDSAMNNLLFSEEFSQKDYNTAIKTFKSQSSVNIDGVYDDFSIKNRDTKPQIKFFFPLWVE